MLKYEKIAKEIENYIHENDLSQGAKLPTLENLILQYNVSKTTIVKALEILVLKGVVYQVQGSGIFVRRRSHKGYIELDAVIGFTNNLKHFEITSKVLEISVIKPDYEVINLLECSKDEEIYYIKRIKYIDNKTMCIEQSYYKKSLVPYLNKEIVEGSIFDYLKNVLNLNIGFSDKYLNIQKLEKQEADLLNLEEGDPCLFTLEQNYLASGENLNFTKLTYNYKNTKFFFQTTRLN